MKRNYFFYLLTLLTFVGFSQSTIVTVDRSNITGPTDTGSLAEISASGLVRGSGVNMATSSADFTSNKWLGTSQADAALNNDYIEWSVTASPVNSIEVTELDIRSRRNNNGPTDWQILYSLDGFATAGTPISAVQSSTTSVTDFNFNGLSIISGNGGTITFRLFAWNSATAGGSWFRISGNTGWSDLGIAKPGVRIVGNVTTSSANSIESNIVHTGFDPADNIDYTLYSATSGLTTTNAIKIGEFNIQDGGDDLTDGDSLETILTALGFNIANSDNIAALAIFDGATNVAEATVSSDSVTFSGLSGISAPDEGTKTLSIYATFNSAVTDNEQVQLTVNLATADAGSGSSFTIFDAGGAQTPITGDDNRIEVTVTELSYGQQPTDSFQFEIMTPFPTVIAVDSNGNQDLDYSTTISVVAAGSLEPAFINYAMVNGTAILNTILFTQEETVTTLISFGGGLAPAVSDPFDIDGPKITLAIQDFDGSTPEWTFSTDVTSFDNGWGLDGYYGIIDAANASPLDYASFTGNIFGENDLFDEGDNGTSGFATMTFDTIDISSYDDIILSFDWDIEGYGNNDDAQYILIYDGVPQTPVVLVDGIGLGVSDEGTVTVNIPNSVSTVALQIQVDNDGLTGYSGFDNFELFTVFDGLLYVDDGVSASWSPNEPTNATGGQNAYVFSGTYTVGSNIELNNFYINDGASTVIASGQSIQINGGIINNGTLELSSVSTSYSSLITDAIQGKVVYNRHVNQFAATGAVTGENDLISPPVTDADQTFLAFRTANPDIPSGTIGGIPSFLFGPFDTSSNAYVNYTAADDLSLLESGIGYRTASTVLTGSTFRFVGDVETGSVSVPIVTGGSTRFNLVGNPYPSYLSLSDFLSANNSEFHPDASGIYGYDGSATDGFTIWNQAYSDANPTAAVTPGQGFLVASKTGGGNISFTPSMRSIGTTDDFIAGRPTSQLAHLKLQMVSENASFNTDFYFNDNASLSMDSGYDASIFNNETPDFALYSHLVENNVGKDLAVQAVNYNALENVIIPLGVNANLGEQITISINETDISDDTEIILEDNVANTFINLKDSDYTLTPTSNLSGTGRFYIHFSNQNLSTSDEIFNGIEIFTNSNPKALVIKGQLESDTEFQLFDIQGRVVSKSRLSTLTTEHSIDVANLKTGIYIVQLQNNSGTRTQKVILK